MFRLTRSSFARLALLAGLSFSTAACVTAGEAVEIDSRYHAGWRPSARECLFGGPTPLVDAYCARLNFGDDGVVAVLRGHNESIVGGQRMLCTDHVARVAQALAPYGEAYEVEKLYSCDKDPLVENGRKVCHVSLAVTDRATGERYVVDNGHVLKLGLTGGVGTYAEFAQQVHVTWTGETPAWIAIGAQ